MLKASDFVKTAYKPAEVGKLLGVSAQTIRNRISSGELGCVLTEGGHRLIRREDLLRYLDKSHLLYNDLTVIKYDVIYARVSSHEQKQKGDLDRQVTSILENTSNLSNVLVLKEVGSGLNDKRRKLLQLIELVRNDKVHTVYVTYRDRLTRFGFHYLSTMFDMKNVKIIVLNETENDRSSQEELVEDMMSLIASFSGKLYGMRSNQRRG